MFNQYHLKLLVMFGLGAMWMNFNLVWPLNVWFVTEENSAIAMPPSCVEFRIMLMFTQVLALVLAAISVGTFAVKLIDVFV